jgi:diadenosine tetraphosphatase ApaH/serine/threonine PP2A family protein phosphatase
MRIAVLSDVHSNLEALRAVLQDCSRKRIDEYICLGDIVGYGADPDDCVSLIRDLTTHIVAGNHDYGVCELTNILYFNNAAQKAIEWSKEAMLKKHTRFLSSLPLVLEHRELLFVHATPSFPDAWNYILSMNDAMREFGFFEQHLCFVGHSHQPVVFSINAEHEIGSSIDESLSCANSKRYIVNAGSVGQPRDGDPRASYVIYDTKKEEITFHRVQYDIATCKEKILDAGLPPFLAQRLEAGR